MSTVGRSPIIVRHQPVTSFPLRRFEDSDDLSVKVLSNGQNVNLTDVSRAITHELQNDNYEYFSSNVYNYVDVNTKYYS